MTLAPFVADGQSCGWFRRGLDDSAAKATASGRRWRCRCLRRRIMQAMISLPVESIRCGTALRRTGGMLRTRARVPANYGDRSPERDRREVLPGIHLSGLIVDMNRSQSSLRDTGVRRRALKIFREVFEGALQQLERLRREGAEGVSGGQELRLEEEVVVTPGSTLLYRVEGFSGQESAPAWCAPAA
jgi:hypothetical protein